MVVIAGDTILLLSPFQAPGASFSISTFTVDAATDMLAWIVSAEATDTITRLGCNASAIESPPTYKISIQGVSTSAAGTPDGTIKGGGSPASATFVPTVGFDWITLDNSYNVTQGEMIAIVIEYESGTIGASNDAAFALAQITSGFNRGAPLTTTSTDTGSTWTPSTNNVSGEAYGGSSTVYGKPAEDVDDIADDTGTADGILANKFVLPVGMATSVSCVGIEGLSGFASATETFKFGIYDSTGHVTPLAETPTLVDEEINGDSTRVSELYFSNAATLIPGTTYYAGIRRVTGNARVNHWTVAEAADMAAFPLGINCHKSEWDGTDTWTDTDTIRIPGFNLIIRDITEPAGSATVIQSRRSIR